MPYVITNNQIIQPVPPKLLIVDDQPHNIHMLNQLFADDHQVFMATCGKQAIQLCQQHLPDLVLLDIEMPDIDGYEVCRQLKADPLTCHIPVIFITGHHGEQDETHGLDVGAVDFISKPINARIVQARVKNHLILKAQSDILRNWAYIDGLTGIHNRRHFDEISQSEWNRAQRNHTPLSLIMLDVDFFKRYNDYYGHLSGDDCLRLVAGTLKSAVNRPGDMVARYGGEEFICLLPETNFDGAMQVGEQLRQDVATLQIPHAASPDTQIITVSMGVCNKPQKETGSLDQLIAQADEQLYQAKQQGRNRVCGAIMLTALKNHLPQT